MNVAKMKTVTAVSNDAEKLPMLHHGLLGGTAGAMGAVIVHPFDLLKVRAQTSKMGLLAVVNQIMNTQGISGFYRGVTSALLRQYTYGLTRFAIFYTSYEWYEHNYGKTPSVPLRLCFASLAGSLGAIVGNPADVVLIRTTADGRLPPEKRRNYTHVFNGLYRIAKEEGILTWWSGVGATMTRAVVVAMAEFATYTKAREVLLPHLGENIGLHFVASMITGFIASAASLPVDIIKTRVQNAPKKMSQLVMFSLIVKNEGFLTLWRGFLPNFARLGPHAVLQFMFFEQLRNIYFAYTKRVTNNE